MSRLAKEIKKKSIEAVSENGAIGFNSTKDVNLDFFSKNGNINYQGNLISDFLNCFKEDSNLAIRNLLHMRDIRNGKGIRTNSRAILVEISQNYPEVILNSNLLETFVNVGRWDDIFEILKCPSNKVSKKIISIVCKELQKTSPNQLLCKWLPRQNKKNAKNNLDILPLLLQKKLKITPKAYRQLLVKNTSVVEQKMCANQWKNINFSHVPSKAHFIYKNAFKKHTPDLYTSYLNALENNTLIDGKEVKINSQTLYPHEIIGTGPITRTQEAMWEAMPNFMPENISILPLIDVSASMNTRAYSFFTAMDISIAIGIYLASKNKSVFKDLFLTFESQSRFINLSDCNTLQAKVLKTRDSPWGGSTNLESSFKEILKLAIKHNIPQEDMPDSLIVISDMHFDKNSSCGISFFKNIEDLYFRAGYQVPKLIWWNVTGGSDRKDFLPVTKHEQGHILISGYSPSILKSIFEMKLEDYTPLNIMLETLSHSRYNWS